MESSELNSSSEVTSSDQSTTEERNHDSNQPSSSSVKVANFDGVSSIKGTNDDDPSESSESLSNTISEEKTVSNLQLIGGVVGNMLEWFDFGIFGYLADPLAHNFFRGSRFVRLLCVYTLFATAFFARPFGGALIGKLGDRIGRKTAIRMSMGLMFGSTFLMGCLPAFRMISYAAPFLLLTLRITQGFSAGGQIVGSFLIFLESAKHKERGFYSSLVQIAGGIGVMLSAATVGACNAIIGSDNMRHWGWRVPFLFSGLFGSLSMIPQHFMEESSDFSEVRTRDQLLSDPMKTAFRRFRIETLMIVLVIGPAAAAYYANFIWLPNFVSHHGYGHAVLLSVPLSLLTGFSNAYGGHLADVYGWNPVLRYSAIGVGVCCLPCYAITSVFLDDWFGIAAVYLFLGCLGGFYIGAMEVFMNDMIDSVSVRFTVMGLAYNTALCFFGGTAPLICQVLGQLSLLAVAGYQLILILVALMLLFYHIPKLLEDRKKDSRRNSLTKGILENE